MKQTYIYSVNLFMWRHFGTSSSRLFNKPAGLALAISNFSLKHKSHFPITAECNLAITDFLDVTFDLKSGTYYPYRKQDNEILYIHKHRTIHHP